VVSCNAPGRHHKGFAPDSVVKIRYLLGWDPNINNIGRGFWALACDLLELPWVAHPTQLFSGTPRDGMVTSVVILDDCVRPYMMFAN
jgi:hypothetical protein